MNRNKKIKDIFYTFIQTWANKQEIYLKIGAASNINTNEFTFDFTPGDGGAAISCEMQMIQSGSGSIIIIPAEGSLVLVGYRDNANPYCLFVEIADDIYINAENTIVFNGGNNEGLVKVSELTEKLNNLEEDINDLKTVFSTWAPSPNDGGAALKTAAATWYASQLVKTLQSEIENTNVKH